MEQQSIHNISNVVQPLDISNLINTIPLETEFVLLGECTHGTQEFYQIRSSITKKLIEERGYNLVLLEGEWPVIWNIDKYINNRTPIHNTAQQALNDIVNFPKWMWNNSIIEELVEWLKVNNTNTHLLGIDCYSLLESKKQLIEFLDRVDPEYSEQVRQMLSFLDRYPNGQQYGYHIVNGELKHHSTQIQSVLQNLLSDLQWNKLPNYKNIDKLELLNAEQNCEILVNADEYYRKMYYEPSGSRACWNIRDQHMTTTLMRLKEYFPDSKIIIWAHNSHIGDALASNTGSNSFDENNNWNLGQMVRQVFEKTEIIGFYTYQGSVTASNQWDGETLKMELKPAYSNSYEDYFHQIAKYKNITSFYLDFKNIINTGNTNTNLDINNFPNQYKTTTHLSIITETIDINSKILVDNIPINSVFNIIDRKYTKYNISRLKIKDSGWITENIPYSNINTYCILTKPISYDNYQFINTLRLQRWVGVQYHPDSELESHYVETKIGKQYDKIIFIDETISLI